MEHFYIQNPRFLQAGEDAPKEAPSPLASLDAGYEYMYDCVRDKKALVFANSREETEYLIATFGKLPNTGVSPIFFSSTTAISLRQSGRKRS